MRAARFVTVFVLVLGALGCAHYRTIGELTSTGFVHDSERYSIAYADASSRSIMGPDWKLENAKPPSGGELNYKFDDFPKWEFDTNEDGISDAWVLVPSADLRFVNLGHGGVIFVRSIPLDAYEEKLELDVLGEHMAEAMSGAQWYAFGAGGEQRVVERRNAVLAEKKQAVTVSSVPGTAVTYSFADVDQLHMSSRARTGKMELVLLRPGTEFSLDNWSGRKPEAWPSRLMLLIGYWNVPSRFEQGYADFDDLLKRVAFKGQSAGLQRGATSSYNSDPEPTGPVEPAAPSAPAPAQVGSSDDEAELLKELPASPFVAPVAPSP